MIIYFVLIRKKNKIRIKCCQDISQLRECEKDLEDGEEIYSIEYENSLIEAQEKADEYIKKDPW